MSIENITIFRVVKSQNYTVSDNTYIDDPRLSLRATGIMTFCLRQRDTWKIRVSAIVEAKKEGRDAVRAGMNELREFGYMVRRVARGEDGQLRTEWQLHEKPPETDLPETGKPATEEPTDGNPVAFISTNTSTKEKSRPKTEKPTEPKPDPFRPLGSWCDDLVNAWNDFVVYRRQLKKPLTEKGAQMLRNRLDGWSETEAAAALRRSMENGWQGVFPLSESSSSRPQGGPGARTPSNNAPTPKAGQVRIW